MSAFFSSSFADFDTSKPYIVKITIKEIDATIKDVDEYFYQMEKAMKSIDTPFVYLLDIRKSKWLNRAVRIKIGLETKKIENKFKHKCSKGFVVVPNAMTKLILKAIHLVSAPQIKQEIFSSITATDQAVKREIEKWNCVY